jgi:hypothetical protein
MNDVIEDSYLATYLLKLHKELELKNLSALETDTFIVQTISYLIFNYSDQHCEFKKKNINPNPRSKKTKPAGIL